MSEQEHIDSPSPETPLVSAENDSGVNKETTAEPSDNVVLETEIAGTPLVPQILVNEQSTPELAINDEIVVEDEPITPIPTTLDEDRESSTVTPDSLSEKPLSVNENDFKGPVIDFYKNKNILMTGVTGFIGKAILWKLIQALREDLGSIYILVRSGSIKRSKIGRPSDRLKNEIFNNKVGRVNISIPGHSCFVLTGIFDFKTHDGKGSIRLPN